MIPTPERPSFIHAGPAGPGLRLLAAVALWAWACLWAGAAWAAEVTARLDRERVVEGETVTLVLQTDDPQQSLETDLDRLATDFHIIDQRSETQMSIVNGRQTAMVRVLVTLEPKRSGRLTIPPLGFRGGATTRPLALQVEAAPELAPGEMPPVFIEVEVEPREGPYYVHAQLSLKVRIFYQQNLTEATMPPPNPDQAAVRLLDEVPYQADRNGERYRVLERRYAVFPERSGELTIAPMQLTGRLIERAADRLWQPNVRGRRVRIESEPLVLDISPRPPSFIGDSWLPARSVELAQQITDGDTITVGEPVTRTILLDAVGLEEHMLEEPVWPAMADARIYPDQPQGISRDDGEWVLGHREYRYAVVPEREGMLVLPEIRLAWWDTVNDRQRVAVLPEHRVTVLPATPRPPEPGSGTNSSGVVPGATTPGAGDARPWQWLSAVLAALWLATLGLLFLRRRRPGPAAPTRDRGEEDEKSVLRALRRAAERGEAREAHRRLGGWLRHFGPAGLTSLSALARRAGDHELAGAVRALDAAAYGSGAEAGWDGKAFWRAFDAWRRETNGRGKDSGQVADALDLYAAAR